MLHLNLPIQYSIFIFYRYQHTKSKINRKTNVENSQRNTKNNRVGRSPLSDSDTAQNYNNQSGNWGNKSTFMEQNRE